MASSALGMTTIPPAGVAVEPGAPAEYRYYCDECDFKTNVKYSLTSHLKLHQDPTYHCQFCERSFRQHQGLTHHMKRIHKLKSLRPRGRPKPVVASADGSDLLGYKCIECDYVASNKDSLRNHTHLHDADMKFECTKCGEKFKQSQSLNYHKNNICIRTCSYCGLRLKTTKRLEVHEQMGCVVLTEEELSDAKCGTCGFVFNSDLGRVDLWNLMAMHKRKCPTVTSNVRCALCLQTFHGEMKLIEHLKMFQHCCANLPAEEVPSGSGPSRPDPSESMSCIAPKISSSFKLETQCAPSTISQLTDMITTASNEILKSQNSVLPPPRSAPKQKQAMHAMKPTPTIQLPHRANPMVKAALPPRPVSEHIMRVATPPSTAPSPLVRDRSPFRPAHTTQIAAPQRPPQLIKYTTRPPQIQKKATPPPARAPMTSWSKLSSGGGLGKTLPSTQYRHVEQKTTGIQRQAYYQPVPMPLYSTENTNRYQPQQPVSASSSRPVSTSSASLPSLVPGLLHLLNTHNSQFANHDQNDAGHHM